MVIRAEAWWQLSRKQYGLISREQLVATGHTLSAIEWKLKTGELERLHSGVYRLRGVPESWAQRALAATMLCGPGAALSHQSAGHLFGLDGLGEGAPFPFDVSLPRGRRHKARGLRVHTCSLPFRVTYRRGIPVTSLVKTVIDLASVFDAERAEFVLDSAHRRYPAIEPWLVHHLSNHGHRGHRGMSLLAELLEVRRGVNTDSAAEVRARRGVRRRGLPTPVLQYVVRDAYGAISPIDLAFPDYLTALHVDGYRWHHQRERFERDAEHRARLSVLGWAQLVVTARQLRDERWLDRLEELLRQRTPQLSLPLR